MWADAIAKELQNVKVTYKIIADGTNTPIGHQFVKYHMISNIDIEDIRQKAWLVAEGHMTKAPGAATYASVLS